MLSTLKQNHFAANAKLVDRFEKHPNITTEVLKSRGTTFEILEALTPSLQTPKLISSAYGQFETILLTIPEWVFLDPPADRDPYKNVYTNLVSKLPKTTNLVILTHQKSLAACQEWVNALGASTRTKIGAAPDNLNFSIWAEDAYCIALDQTDNETYFIESAAFDRYDDEYIADEVAKFTDLEISLANVYFQGGNVLIGDDYWLIGLDYPNNSFKLDFIKQEGAESKLEATRRVYGKLMDHGRTLYPIGTHLPVPKEAAIPQQINGTLWNHIVYRGNRAGTTQPLFHIDMFITLLGKSASGNNLVMVADPSMARQTLGELDFVVFASQFSMQAVFDDIAKRLQDIGFEVIRNPLPPAYAVNLQKKEISWYFATANNALVQVTPTSKDIWVPQYGFGDFSELAATDMQTRRILEAQGFTVHALGDFHPFALGLGAVHCIKKYIART